MKRTIVYTLLILSGFSALSQDKVITTCSTTGDHIKIKYYTHTVFYDSDINFYRKELQSDSWTKLNNQALHWGDYSIPQNILHEDIQTRVLTTAIDSLGTNQIEGFLLLITLMKSFESEPFSKFLGIQFNDSLISKGKTYVYRVTRVTNQGEQEIGISEPILAGTYIPPLPPQDIAVKVKRRNIDIKWRPESKRYFGVNIYRKSTLDSSWTKIVEQPVMIGKKNLKNGQYDYAESFYRETNMQEEVTYQYKFTAIDFFGHESPYSTVFNAPIKDDTPPDPPIVNEAVVEENSMNIRLSWTYPNHVPDLAGFNIYRSQLPNGTFIQQNTELLPKTVFTFSNQTEAPSPYYYYIEAVDYVGNKNQSKITYALVPDLLPPASPNGLSANGDSIAVTLQWSPNTEIDFKGYQIYRMVDDDPKNQVLLNGSLITEPKFVDKIGSNSKNSYQYFVVSLDTAFNKSNPSPFVNASLIDTTPPNKPFIKQVDVSENGLHIQWLSAVDDDIESFLIYRVSDKQDTLLAILPPTTLSYLDQNVIEDIGYDYYLLARDSSKNISNPSNSYHGIWVKEKTRTEFSITKMDYDSLSQGVNIEWEENIGVDGYILYRKTAEAEFKPITGLIDKTSYTDKNISKGQQYYYRLSALSTEGKKGESNTTTIEIN